MCMFCRSLFGLFLLAIVLSVLWFTDYVYPFGIFKHFLLIFYLLESFRRNFHKVQLFTNYSKMIKKNFFFFLSLLYIHILIIYMYHRYIIMKNRKIIPLINVNFSSKCSFRKLSRFIIFIIIRLKTIIHIFVRFYNSN